LKKNLLVLFIVVFLLVILFGCAGKDNLEFTLAESAQIYYLENPTEKDEMERMLYITLFDDGKAQLAQVPIGSYLLPKCTYSIKDGELLIHAVIETEFDEEFFGLNNNDIIARFTVFNKNTLVFQSSDVVFADAGARYVYTPGSVITPGSK